jgi:NADPH-ferrihemoprotein reductase
MAEKLATQLNTDPNTIIGMYPVDDKTEKNPIVGPCTLKAALRQYYDIASPIKKPILKVLVQHASDPDEKNRLKDLASEEPEKQELYEKYIVHDCRCITEVLEDFKSIKVPLDHFLEVLPKMQPRYYSISSSHNDTPGRVTLTAVLVQYTTPTKRLAHGVATTWLSNHRADPEKKSPSKNPGIYQKKCNFQITSIHYDTYYYGWSWYRFCSFSWISSRACLSK